MLSESVIDFVDSPIGVPDRAQLGRESVALLRPSIQLHNLPPRSCKQSVRFSSSGHTQFPDSEFIPARIHRGSRGDSVSVVIGSRISTEQNREIIISRETDRVLVSEFINLFDKLCQLNRKRNRNFRRFVCLIDPI